MTTGTGARLSSGAVEALEDVPQPVRGDTRPVVAHLEQIVNANQQALAAAVQEFRADCQKEVSKLPELLKMAKATPFGKPVRVIGGQRVSG